MNPEYIPKTVDEYIGGYPVNIQEKLFEIQQIIRQAAPEAIEKISYRMPSFSFNGMLVYFAAFKNHIGFYPFTSAIEAFREELTGYKCSKGTVQFPNDKPIPLQLIASMVEFRVHENILKADSKTSKKRVKPNNI
jgi:uncharacterized protein YdhG (YjbR/CyaY superfamily)